MRSAILSVSVASGVLLAAATGPQYRISGPYTHENLSIFLIHGAGSGKNYVTLQEAMAKKKVIVYETKNVNQLAVENVSDESVFMQGGDIVKGGQQDRVVTNDFVLPPRSGRVPIASFCVEQGRWTRRGSENAAMFQVSSEMVSTKPLKRAVTVDKNQAEVWREVAKTQDALGMITSAERVGGSGAQVRAPSSPSSLQLTLESKPVADAVDGYVKALSGVIAGKPDVLGFAFAVNGDLNSADVYSSRELFLAMWPKLLRSSAVEALRLRRPGAFEAASTAAVEALLRDAENGKTSTVEVDHRVKLVSHENDNQALVESRESGGWIHRNYIRK
jgi:hypothetical protein